MSGTGTWVWDTWPREELRARGFGQKAVPKIQNGCKIIQNSGFRRDHLMFLGGNDRRSKGKSIPDYYRA